MCVSKMMFDVFAVKLVICSLSFADLKKECQDPLPWALQWFKNFFIKQKSLKYFLNSWTVSWKLKSDQSFKLIPIHGSESENINFFAQFFHSLFVWVQVNLLAQSCPNSQPLSKLQTPFLNRPKRKKDKSKNRNQKSHRRVHDNQNT